MIWFVLLALTLMLAFYVAAEFAAVSVRKSRIQQRAEEGSKLARQLLPILSDPHRLDNYIAASQIGITISTLVSGAYAQRGLTPVLVPLFTQFGTMKEEAAASASAILILVVLTIVQMVLGELIPKSLALQYPTRVAQWTVIPMLWSGRLMSLFITLLNGSGGLLLRLMRVPPAGHGHVHSPDEIEFLIAESGKGGVFKPNEQVRLRHALQLGQRSARELMTPRTLITAIDVETPMEEVTQIAIECPYTRIPVFEGTIDNIIGIVHVRDLALGASADVQATALRPMMQSPLVLPESINADRLLLKFKEERRTMAILVDEFGGTAGLITIDNVLDELIGDIADEFRPAAAVPEPMPDGRVRLPGLLPVSEAAVWTRVRWTTRYATVGGLTASLLHEQPKVGDRVTIEGVEVEVERVHRRAVLSVIVRPVRVGEERP